MRNVLSPIVVIILPLIAAAQTPNTEELLQQAQEAVNFENIQASTEGFLAELNGSTNFATEFKADDAEARLKHQDFKGQEEIKAIASRGAQLPVQEAIDSDAIIARADAYDLDRTHMQLATKIKALEMFKEDEKNDELGSAIEQLNMLDKMVASFDGKIPQDPKQLKIFAGNHRKVRIRSYGFQKGNEDLEHLVNQGHCSELSEAKKSRLFKSKKVYRHYCCFESKFSRIVREGLDAQGLTSLGDGEAARCATSIEIEKLAELDWSQLDLSELITDDGSELQSHIQVEALTPVEPEVEYLAALSEEEEDDECDPVEMEKNRPLTLKERINKMRRQKKGDDDE
jgi:hypothetical protein